jgi:cell division protein FtsZ
MNIKLELPKLTDLRPRITVIGVGGAGGNAINNMIASGLEGVEFVVANTDAQALAQSSAEHRIQLGVNLTEGLGAGSRPEIGQAAAEEALDEIRTQISGSHMVFVAAGMGGGTGSGAAGVIARIAKDLGVLTVGIVTKPFQFEGARRLRVAEAGIAELARYVDTLIVIPNQNLFRIANERTTFAEAFVLADQVLYSGIACIVDLIVKDGLINLDFADVRTVMSGMGTAMMGTGEATGDRRAILAAEEAITNPLLDDVSLKGARGLLLSIIGGKDMTLYEVDEAASRIRQEVDPEANIIVGASFDEAMGDRLRVSIVASGMARSGDVRSPVAAMSASIAAYVPAAAPPRPTAPPPLPGGSQAPAESLANLLAKSAERPAHFAQAELPTWHAPGDVRIQQGLPSLGLTTAGKASAPSPTPTGAASTETFTPQAAPLPTGQLPRRMPEVEDFPPVGQREYRARAAGSALTGAAPSPAAGPRVYKDADTRATRKPGLFERLTGFGRTDGESRRNARESYPQGSVHTSQASTPGPEQEPATRGHHDARRVHKKSTQGPELPVFFDRGRS